ncbi:MAG TPA: hypothetical protein VIM16_10585 [Mucilaginibacter sp.]|jgi:hypothetical protein
MKPQIKYIELKSGYSDDGPAWIGKVEFSKTGQTTYFNNRAFKGNGHGSCFDIETKKTYWITGIKKNGQNRHWAGKGKIMIDKLVVDDYLKLIDLKKLDLEKFELVDIDKTDKKRFTAIENGSTDLVDVSDKYPELKNLSIDELKNTIEYLTRRENYTNPNNGQKYITVKKLEAEKLLEQRQSEE